MTKTLVVVCGPTATGKTKLGVALAHRFNGEVVSADSMQLYRGMAVGTAQPTREEMEGVPHHMMAIAQPGENYSAARYVEEATRVVEDIFRRGKQPIVVGGTGQYIDALVKGQTFSAFTPETGCRRRLQERAAREGLDVLWAELESIDPETAAKVHPHDEKRVIRALEVWQETGETLSAHNRRTKAVPPRYRALTIALTYADRADLYARIDRRVDVMLAQGLTDEVRDLLARGVPPDCTAMQAIGYKELTAAVQDPHGDIAAAAEEVKLRSRQYAKRQLTWFRKNPDAHWVLLDRDPDFSAVVQDSTDFLRQQGLP